MQSSLIETLQNSFQRFSELGLCTLTKYDKTVGPPSVFVSVSMDLKAALDDQLSLLESLSSVSGNGHKAKVVEMEVGWILKPRFKL